MGISGKYSTRKRHFRVPIAAWVLLLIAGATVITGTVTAFLSAATNPVKNEFETALNPVPSISETFDGNAKTNVSVDLGETGAGYAVFVRARIVVTWKDSSGNVYRTTPIQGTHYTMTCNSAGGWFEKDGFWYCKTALSSGKTPILIDSCAPIAETAPDGYTLNVEVLAQTIQALGTTDDASQTPAVTQAWGVTLSGEQIVP